MIDKTKPRIAVFYDVLRRTGFRDDGCALFLNYNLRKIIDGAKGPDDLSVLDKNVLRLSPSRPFERFGTFDLNVLVDYGEDALGIPLDWEIPHPNAYWISDAHLGYKYRMERAKKFDHVFVAQKAFIPELVKDGIPEEKIHYLPHAYEPDVYRPILTIKKYDWTFIGHPNSEHRIELLDHFIKQFKRYYLGWRIPGAHGYNELEDCNEKYNQSNLVINDAIKGDLNMRVFESLGSGACLLTEAIPEMSGMFQGQKHLLYYKTIDEAIDIAGAILADDEKRQAIASAGHAEVMSKHTYRHRALDVLKVCLNYDPKEEEKCLSA